MTTRTVLTIAVWMLLQAAPAVAASTDTMPWTQPLSKLGLSARTGLTLGIGVLVIVGLGLHQAVTGHLPDTLQRMGASVASLGIAFGALAALVLLFGVAAATV